MSAKLQEAQEHCRAAEKYLKTSFLKWKPDYDSAADEYSQAAQCYRIARDLKNSKECHLKASEMYNNHKAFFHAGKALENAILVCKETSHPEEIYKLATEAANLYQQQGSGDSAAAVLDKAAKIVENDAPELAYKLFSQAAEVSSNESSQHQGAEYISKASRILVKLQRAQRKRQALQPLDGNVQNQDLAPETSTPRSCDVTQTHTQYDQAVDSLRREIGFHQESGNMGAIGRLTMAVVLVQLARGDAVAAEKAYKEWGNNCDVAEMQTIEQLLTAYDEEDREAARRALMSPFIRSMDVEYARLAQMVPLPEALEPTPSAGIRENAAPSYVSPNAQNNEQASSEVDNSQSYEEVASAKPNEEEEELC